MMRSYANFIKRCLWLLILCGLLSGGLSLGQGLPSAEIAFDAAESPDPLHQVVLPRLYAIIGADISPSLGDATLINRFRFIVSLAMVDAAAPYHPTAVGMYSRIPRRPQEEWTDANINTAMLHGAYNALMGLLPERQNVWRDMLRDIGLDPDDTSVDLETAVGIGNVAGKSAHEARLYDGINQSGDYQDTTGYAPVNSAFDLRDPSRWQPGLRRQGVGVYTVQHFVTPQLSNMEPMAPFDPRELRVAPPEASYAVDSDAYKAQMDVVLETSANLNDERKVASELFDNKIASLGLSYIHLAGEMDLSPADIARGYFLKVSAWMDASIVTWQEKLRYDAVRPNSAIAYVYGDELVAAWGGPGEGTQEMPANEWQAYLPEPDHPEYPSGSTCGCYAHAQALRRFSGTDELNWSVSYPAGSSRIEPGVTPADDTTLTFDTWSGFAESCGKSRHWSGVHFVEAVEASAAYCSVFGDQAYDYYLTLLDGSAALRQPAQALPADPWLQAARQAPAPRVLVPQNTYPTPQSCKYVDDSVSVTAVNNGVTCEEVDMSGLTGLSQSLEAIVIAGELDFGAQVCFEQPGSIVMLENGGIVPSFHELLSYQAGDSTCAWINQPGTVMLVASQPLLTECQVTTTGVLNLRRTPEDGEVIGLIQEGVQLLVAARTPYWYNVRYGSRDGWISGDFVQANSFC